MSPSTDDKQGRMLEVVASGLGPLGGVQNLQQINSKVKEPFALTTILNQNVGRKFVTPFGHK